MKLKYRIAPPKLNTVLEMTEEAYKKLDRRDIHFTDTGEVIPAKAVNLGKDFYLLCPETEFEAINE